MFNIKILFFLSVFLILGCSHIHFKKYENANTLKKFSSTREALSYLNDRDQALEKLNEYAPPYQYSGNSWFSRLLSKLGIKSYEEEIIVTGLRASEVGAMPNSYLADALMRAEDVSITNNQEAAVDEGGIVKRLGNYLIVLRKGKLYSILVGEQLDKVDEINLQLITWQHEAWYDELLVYQNILLVIGYSYENESTEYVFFELDKEGKLHRKYAYLVSSGDYYSDNNYAGRMVGDKFVFYIEDLAYDFKGEGGEYDKEKISPMTLRVDDNGKIEESYPLFENHQIYSPVLTSRYLYFTTAVTCPINVEKFQCDANSILSGEMEDFYVSKEAFYFWMRGTEWNIEYASMPPDVLERYAHSKRYEHRSKEKYAAIYRVPFNDEPVSVVKVKGSPIDQFSFKQSQNMLHIVGTNDQYKKKIWSDSFNFESEVFFTSIPLVTFNEGVTEWDESQYILIEREKTNGSKNNRFVGHSLVYSNSDYESGAASVYVLNVIDPNIISKLETHMEVEQLHPIGKNMLLVGYDDQDSVQYQTLAMEQNIHIADTLTELDNKLAESRSHGFFYKPDTEGGVFAIPTFIELEKNKKRVNGTYYFAEEISDMRYIRVTNNLTLNPAGLLEGSKEIIWQNSDDCELSCYDWYGSSRPIFWGDRIFALLKYEIVEGVHSGDVVEEIQRIDIRD